jgi:SAM-dependent methyltransferase
LGWLRAKLQLSLYVVRSIARRGLWRTAKIVWFEFYCEWQFGAGTGGIIGANDLDGDTETLAHASASFPSSFLVLHEVVRCGLPSCEGRVLVDLGCGRGRALMFFATLPLQKVIGVEFSQSLCRTATDNMRRFYCKNARTMPEWEIVNCDARHFDVPDDATIFYLFNPFDAVVLREVMRNIVRSIRRQPRECTIVYANPVHAGELFNWGMVRTSSTTQDFAIFKIGPDI